MSKADPEPFAPPVIPPGSWRESLTLVALASVLIALMTAPAFNSFFFSENFVYWGQYTAHDSNFWRALTSPTGVGFRYQPVFFLCSWPWHYLLPLNPFAYHLRNFLFIAVNLLLLHRILLHLIAHRLARILAIGFFAVSKIHMTTIGYINIFDSIVLLMLLLTTLLFFIRYLKFGKLWDCIAAILSCALSIFSKDYGLVIIAVIGAAAISFVLAAAPARRRQVLARGTWVFAVALVLGAIYLWTHYAVAGGLTSSDPVYAPQISLKWMSLKTLLFFLTACNQSPFTSGVMGASSVAGVLSCHAPALSHSLPTELCIVGSNFSVGDAALFIAFISLLGFTLLATHLRWTMMVFPVVWIAVYLAPTFLVRNTQIYYNHESLAGLAVLIALAVDRSAQRLQQSWSVAVLAIGISGLVSDWHSLPLYTWAYVARQAEEARRPVIEKNRSQPIQAITFITNGATRSLWIFALGSKGFPLLPTLLARPNLSVKYIGYRELPPQMKLADATHLLIDVDNGFLYYPKQLPPPLKLRFLTPTCAVADRGFNVQSDGESALVAAAEYATPSTSIVFDRTKLVSRYNSADRVTALIPRSLLEQGVHELHLDDGVRQSNKVSFRIMPGEPNGANLPTESSTRGVKWPQQRLNRSTEPQLSADPNPLPYTGGGPGTATIRWNTGDGSWGEVYVSVDGGPDKLFAAAPEGSAKANWIKPGKSFQFKLYRDSDTEAAEKVITVQMSL